MFMKLVIINIFLMLFTLSAVAGTVNINTASAQQMQINLKGIGVSKAAAIVAYREQNGPFQSIDELANVKGISKKILERNRLDIKLSADD